MKRSASHVCLIMCLLVSSNALTAAEQDAVSVPPKPPELKVLDKLIGNWDTATLLKPAAWSPKETRSTGRASIEWILDGRFIQQKSTEGEKSESIVMHTYDVQKKAYRYWIFGSNGNSIEAAGRWEAATQTFFWKSEAPDGVTVLTSTHFIDADTFEWTLRAIDVTGKICIDGSGKARRRK